jgi:N-acetylglucosaminyl-diphospho-decaprenol L-rhamnosyltransferase
MPSVTVIIVNFNTGRLARRCVETVAAELANVEWNGVVVDNASTDDSRAHLKDIPHVRVIANERNVGFGAAVNQAAARCESNLLFLLNPDCELTPGAFGALVETLDAYSDCAIAAPRLLNADGSTQESARGEPTAWTGLFGRHTLLTRFLPSSALARRNLRAQTIVDSGVESAPVDWVMGAAMLVRREAFEQVGGFDERYFLYWEDADLCRRLRERGWSTRFVPGAIVRHSGAGSARSDSAAATRAFHRSAYRYYATHVVTSPLHPLRWFARAALALRAAWRIRRER